MPHVYGGTAVTAGPAGPTVLCMSDTCKADLAVERGSSEGIGVQLTFSG